MRSTKGIIEMAAKQEWPLQVEKPILHTIDGDLKNPTEANHGGFILSS
jgi:hypothetical protein